MNLTKNMEALFLVATILTCASAFAAVPHASVAQRVMVDTSAHVNTVIISAKRLSAAEKAQLPN
ncbi:MAG: hypothetical protein V4582_22655 [Pseudomonadota bacterium]